MLSAAAVSPPDPQKLDGLKLLAASMAAHPHGSALLLALLATWLVVWLGLPRKRRGDRREPRRKTLPPGHPVPTADEGP